MGSYQLVLFVEIFTETGRKEVAVHSDKDLHFFKLRDDPADAILDGFGVIRGMDAGLPRVIALKKNG